MSVTERGRVGDSATVSFETGDRRQSLAVTGTSTSSNSNSSSGLTPGGNNHPSNNNNGSGKPVGVKKAAKVTHVTLHGDQQQGGLILLSKMDSYSRQVAFETMKKSPALGNTSRLGNRQNANLYMVHKDLDKMCMREVQRAASDTRMVTVDLSRTKRELLNKQKILHRQRRRMLTMTHQRTVYLTAISEQHRQRDALHQQLDISIRQTQLKDEDAETGLPSLLTLVSLNRNKAPAVTTLTAVA